MSTSIPSTPSRSWVTWLAIGGLAIVALQVWGYGAWLLTSSLTPLHSSAPQTNAVLDRVRLAELTSIAGAMLWLIYVAWDWSRRRSLTWPLLWTIAWACAFWQEPLVNVTHRTFAFNPAFHNLGDWTRHLPFVPSSYTPLPEALILEGLVFLYLLPLLAIGVTALLRLLRRILPGTPIAVLVVIAYLAVVAFDIAFELQGVHQGLLRYPEVGGPAISGGSPHQWPILEGFGLGAAWAFPGILTFLITERRPADHDLPRWWRGGHRDLMTTLAAIGAVNLAFGIYNALYVSVMHGTAAHGRLW